MNSINVAVHRRVVPPRVACAACGEEKIWRRTKGWVAVFCTRPGGLSPHTTIIWTVSLQFELRAGKGGFALKLARILFVRALMNVFGPNTCFSLAF